MGNANVEWPGPAIGAAEAARMVPHQSVVMDDTMHFQRAAIAYEMADEIPLDSDGDADELVEGIIVRRSFVALFGDSNTGKTFLAIDLACSVARGIPWLGRRAEKGLVVYLAAESPASVRTRLRAYQHHHGVRLHDLAVVISPVNFFAGPDASAVIELIRTLENEHGVKCELVVVDTLARVSAGANENSGDDMGRVIALLDRIRSETDVAVLLIHHIGKDSTRGMRGWSGLRAALDTELEITTDGSGLATLEATKQRDIDGKGARLGFRLHPVDLGPGKWRRQTSCVVVPADAPEAQRRMPRLGAAQQAIVSALKGHGADMPLREIATALQADFRRTSIYNAADRLRDLGLLEITGGIAHLIRP